MHHLYFSRELAFRVRVSRTLQIMATIVASGSLVTLASPWPGAMPFIIAIAGVLSAIGVGWFAPGDVAKLSKIASHWDLRSNEWDDLWVRIESGQAIADELLRQARAEDSRLSTDEVQFKIPAKERDQVFAQTLKTVQEEPARPPASPAKV